MERRRDQTPNPGEESGGDASSGVLPRSRTNTAESLASRRIRRGWASTAAQLSFDLSSGFYQPRQQQPHQPSPHHPSPTSSFHRRSAQRKTTIASHGTAGMQAAHSSSEIFQHRVRTTSVVSSASVSSVVDTRRRRWSRQTTPTNIALLQQAQQHAPVVQHASFHHHEGPTQTIMRATPTSMRRSSPFVTPAPAAAAAPCSSSTPSVLLKHQHHQTKPQRIAAASSAALLKRSSALAEDWRDDDEWLYPSSSPILDERSLLFAPEERRAASMRYHHKFGGDTSDPRETAVPSPLTSVQTGDWSSAPCSDTDGMALASGEESSSPRHSMAVFPSPPLFQPLVPSTAMSSKKKVARRVTYGNGPPTVRMISFEEQQAAANCNGFRGDGGGGHRHPSPGFDAAAMPLSAAELAADEQKLAEAEWSEGGEVLHHGGGVLPWLKDRSSREKERLREFGDGSSRHVHHQIRGRSQSWLIRTRHLINPDGRFHRQTPLISKFLFVLSILLLIFTFPFCIPFCLKVSKEYERAVVFRLGRLIKGGTKGPGMFFLMPCIDSCKIEILSCDSVTVSVEAVIYFRISNPVISVTNVNDAQFSTKLLAQTTLRNVLGTKTLSEILAERDIISNVIEKVLDDGTDPWGVKVERVEIKDIRLPHQLMKSMAAEAEAARDARAKIIAADGERSASRSLVDAADVIGGNKVSLHLRYLQTLVRVASEHNHTYVVPVPLELARRVIKGLRSKKVSSAKAAAQTTTHHLTRA